ncbi:hypothetical protein [Heliorestis convoluta]|uniref:Uncharacterized protein n=1 Tax=Heliorestis convoluta TaxID=356322 RepID=A0A5Q2MXV6_9FIRM|nr:hypothetical protein [Heliorestis convoluta]QGG47654.1 hypothetical protein FTV88_1554 [Heliorestis convoluta]
MTNKRRGFIDIELDRPRQLRYTLNAFAEIEERLGVPLAELGNIKLGMKTVRTILWAGLLHEDISITEEEVGDMVGFEKLEYVQRKIAEAFEVATGKKE